MAEQQQRPPQPPIPRPVVVADMVIDTSWAQRRTRFYFTTDVAPTGLTDLEAICNRLMAVYGPLVQPLVTTQVKILRFEGRWYGPGTQGFEANSTAAALVGTQAAVTPNSGSESMMTYVADTLPDEVSLIIQKRTGNTGRGKFGRWFFTGISEAFNNHGQIPESMLSDPKNLANALSNDVTVTGAYSTILHPRHWQKFPTNQLHPITKCYALRVLGTRRDRRRPLKLERA